MVFCGDFADSVICPTCGAERYSRNEIPSKSFTYFPIGPRIVCMFESPVYSELIQAHASSLQDEPELVYDIQQSEVRKEAYGSDGIFKGDGRGIALALCADGVNPFHVNRVQYSMCPLVMSLLSLPQRLRYQFSNLLLVGIIPGPKEPQSMNSYLDILVDELMEVNTRHIYDAHLGEEFDLSMRILSYVLDYPGISKLTHWVLVLIKAVCGVKSKVIFPLLLIIRNNVNLYLGWQPLSLYVLYMHSNFIKVYIHA